MSEGVTAFIALTFAGGVEAHFVIAVWKVNEAKSRQ
jgi:hypothetical protein